MWTSNSQNRVFLVFLLTMTATIQNNQSLPVSKVPFLKSIRTCILKHRLISTYSWQGNWHPWHPKRPHHQTLRIDRCRKLNVRVKSMKSHILSLSPIWFILASVYYLKWFLLIVASLYLPFHSLQRYLKDQNWDLNEAHADGVMIGHSGVALS